MNMYRCIWPQSERAIHIMHRYIMPERLVIVHHVQQDDLDYNYYLNRCYSMDLEFIDDSDDSYRPHC